MINLLTSCLLDISNFFRCALILGCGQCSCESLRNISGGPGKPRDVSLTLRSISGPYIYFLFAILLDPIASAMTLHSQQNLL